VADLAAAHANLNWVYYCVDDLSVWPGLDGAAIGLLEKRMLPLMRTVVAASEVLAQRLAALGCRPLLLTHGVDVEQWLPAAPRIPCPPYRAVRALYWGSADARLSTGICMAIAELCELRLVGPADGLDPALANHPRIRVLPPVAHGELPGLAATADVLVMPYADLAVTRAMQPLKLKEYLATGLPVVASALPATRHWADAMDVTGDRDEFARLCLWRGQQPLPESHRRARRRIAGESWTAKAEQFEHLLTGETAAKTRLPSL
jgi:glycosyltransferase involved in cell wall biosynthesis